LTRKPFQIAARITFEKMKKVNDENEKWNAHTHTEIHISNCNKKLNYKPPENRWFSLKVYLNEKWNFTKNLKDNDARKKVNFVAAVQKSKNALKSRIQGLLRCTKKIHIRCFKIYMHFSQNSGIHCNN
jgi:hypothetical protein